MFKAETLQLEDKPSLVKVVLLFTSIGVSSYVVAKAVKSLGEEIDKYW